MKRFLREHWFFLGILLSVGTYVFISSGLSGVMAANFPAPDGGRTPTPLGDAIAFVFFGVLFSIARLLIPFALVGGQFEYGNYAVAQFPLVVSLVLLSLVVARWRKRSVVLWGTFAYMGAMLLTNDLAGEFRVDHSNDFPLDRQFASLRSPDKPTLSDVLRVAGPPVAQSTFLSTDPALPKSVRESMAYWKRGEALIYAYYEEDDWDRANTYYVMFDEPTGERFSMVTIHSKVSADLWPNLRP